VTYEFVVDFHGHVAIIRQKVRGVEKVGTGTEDIITKCHDYGLQTPEFHQEEGFRVVIWRNKTDVTPPSYPQKSYPPKLKYYCQC
jgi:hypothetical protein